MDGAGNTALNPAAALSVYRGQLAASVFLVVGSIVSLWMVRRRRFLCSNDGENAKRREMSRFIKAIKESERSGIGGEPAASSARLVEMLSLPGAARLNGTALTVIYLVYRRSDSVGDDSSASWSGIPSLLLVDGDYVALQVGDISPADCVIANPLSSEEFSCVAAGDRIELSFFGDSPTSIIDQLPRGRTTLPIDSDHLLTLCNKMRIFRVQKAPLDDFLHRSPIPSKPSQIWRQIKEIRKALSAIALVVMIATTAIVFLRPGAASDELSLLLPLPLLAALGVLPVVAPAFIFYLEVLGTARILVTVHPHASSSHEERESGKSKSTRLLLRYILATTLSRLSLWSVADWVRQNLLYSGLGKAGSGSHPSKLVRVPPASINLLEKLGVVTAFTLVDDELVCDPHAIPQQLLIPSGKGLKLLDMCPAYDEDSDDESAGSANATARGRGKVFDSDSDDSDDETLNFKEGLRRKILRRRHLKRGRKLTRSGLPDEDNTDDTDDTSLEMQFEDPLWWQHLPSLKCIGLACLLIGEPRAQLETEKEELLPAAGPEDEAEGCLADDDSPLLSSLRSARSTLVRQVCSERKTNQLQYLAQCIGFSTDPSSFGSKGDLTPFVERMRFHVLSDRLFKERLEIDAHERSSEQSRWWGLIRPDSTSVVVQDNRSGAYQILTVGDPAVVTSFCNEAWQGEISTILPLGAADRRTIVETTNNWKLGDLDVAAFSYSPVPRTLESLLVGDDSVKSQVSVPFDSELNSLAFSMD
jgi:hypothetical protein